MAKRLVTQVTAFQANDGTLYESYADAAVESAGDRIAELVINSREQEHDEDGMRTSYGNSVNPLFPDGNTYGRSIELAAFIQFHKAAFKAILRDL